MRQNSTQHLSSGLKLDQQEEEEIPLPHPIKYEPEQKQSITQFYLQHKSNLASKMSNSQTREQELLKDSQDTSPQHNIEIVENPKPDHEQQHQQLIARKETKSPEFGFVSQRE